VIDTRIMKKKRVIDRKRS